MKRILGRGEPFRKEILRESLAVWPRTPMVFAARGIIFAGADTLYDDSLWLRWLHVQLRRKIAINTFEEVRYAWDEVSDDLWTGRATSGEALLAMLQSLGVPRMLCSELGAAAQTRRGRLFQESRPLAGVRQAIAQFARQGLALGVLANSEVSGEQLKGWLHSHGLSQFQSVVTSQDLGTAKPHAAAYLQAVLRLRLKIDDVIYVGSRERELAGAESVGLRAIACPARARSGRLWVNSLIELTSHVTLRRLWTQAG
ncbi:MAG: HAD hydrolase-like protein [Pirellulales bacterium]|nr:HAD hydrolase-like protein [Pirellulales bacterium]